MLLLVIAILAVLLAGVALILKHEHSVAQPSFDIWYGDVQHFGLNGHPQRWVNILGHVAPGESIKSLRYSLNGGEKKALSYMEDFKRLARTGDFNVEIDRAELQPGENTVHLHAMTHKGLEGEHLVRIIYDPNDNKWPLPYKIDWRKVSRISDVAQVVDGKWKLTSQGVRSIESYYDRVIAIGDSSWRDYEVTASVIFHKFTPPKVIPNKTGVTHAAITLRWPGHDKDGNQPSIKWHPLGATAEFQLSRDLQECRWCIFDGKKDFRVASDRTRAIQLERLYYLKHSVETLSEGQSRYRVKLWPEGEPEPADWDLERYETDDLVSGSALLIAHHTDVTFVEVEANPIPAGPQYSRINSLQSYVK